MPGTRSQGRQHFPLGLEKAQPSRSPALRLLQMPLLLLLHALPLPLLPLALPPLLLLLLLALPLLLLLALALASASVQGPILVVAAHRKPVHTIW